MSLVSSKPCCVRCGAEITIVKCKSCWQAEGSRRSTAQYHEINTLENISNGNYEMITEQRVTTQQHAMIQQVDDWERNAMNNVRQTAEEARRLIMKHATYQFCQIGEKLSVLGDQIRRSCQESEVLSENVSQWQDELSQLTSQLVIPSTIEVKEISTPLVTKIVVRICEQPLSVNNGKPSIPNIRFNSQWIQNGLTVAGGNGQGSGLNQFAYPCSFYIDDDQTIYVADCLNHRIVEWRSGARRGRIVAGGNDKGNQDIQLNQPRAVIVHKENDSLIICDASNKRIVQWPRQNGIRGETIISDIQSYELAMDNDGYLYISDYDRHEVKRWKIGDADGIVVAGGNGKGSRLNQLSHPMQIFVDQEQTIYVTDTDNHRVMKWIKGAEEGIVVAGGQGEGSELNQLSGPRGLFVDQLGTVYVTDYRNHRIMRWTKGAVEGTVAVGGNGQGSQTNQFFNCVDVALDKAGNLFVCDLSNHRIQMFNINQKLDQD